MELSLCNYREDINILKTSRNRDLLFVQSEYKPQQCMHTYTSEANILSFQGLGIDTLIRYHYFTKSGFFI